MFVSKLVKDRFEKQVIMMEQNGLDRWTYWLVTYVFDYLLYICVTVVVTMTSLAFSMRLFTQVWSGEEVCVVIVIVTITSFSMRLFTQVWSEEEEVV